MTILGYIILIPIIFLLIVVGSIVAILDKVKDHRKEQSKISNEIAEKKKLVCNEDDCSNNALYHRMRRCSFCNLFFCSQHITIRNFRYFGEKAYCKKHLSNFKDDEAKERVEINHWNRISLNTRDENDKYYKYCDKCGKVTGHGACGHCTVCYGGDIGGDCGMHSDD